MRFTKGNSVLCVIPFQGCWGKYQHPMYTTSSNEYGRLALLNTNMPSQFHGISGKFTQHLAAAGMYTKPTFDTSGKLNLELRYPDLSPPPKIKVK